MEFNKLIPELLVSSFEESLKFYTKGIGFNVKYTRDKPRFAMLEYNGAQIMIEEIHNTSPEWITGKMEKPFGRGINLQVEVEDLENIVHSLKENQYKLRTEPKTTTYKTGNTQSTCTQFLIEDPDGYLIRIQKIC